MTYVLGNYYDLYKITKSEINIIKRIRNLFAIKTENKATKDRIIRDIRTLLKEEDNYFRPIKAGNVWNNNYIEYKSNGIKIKRYQ